MPDVLIDRDKLDRIDLTLDWIVSWTNPAEKRPDAARLSEIYARALDALLLIRKPGHEAMEWPENRPAVLQAE